MSKKVLTPVPIIQAGDMSGDLTSTPVKIQFLDVVSMQLVFTDTPTGTFEVQASLDYSVNDAGEVTNAGTWVTVPVQDETGSSPAATGSADQLMINMTQLAFPFIRLHYTATSGTGTLDVLASGKEI